MDLSLLSFDGNLSCLMMEIFSELLLSHRLNIM